MRQVRLPSTLYLDKLRSAVSVPGRWTGPSSSLVRTLDQYARGAAATGDARPLDAHNGQECVWCRVEDTQRPNPRHVFSSFARSFIRPFIPSSAHSPGSHSRLNVRWGSLYAV